VSTIQFHDLGERDGGEREEVDRAPPILGWILIM
jgi:hypothetical protein